MNDGALFVYNENSNQVLLMKLNFPVHCVPTPPSLFSVDCSVYLSLLQTPEDSEQSVSQFLLTSSTDDRRPELGQLLRTSDYLLSEKSVFSKLLDYYFNILRVQLFILLTMPT